MPSGAKKRKAAKKKKFNDSSSTNPHQVVAGENDGGELSSPTSQDPSVEVVKREDSSSKKISEDANVQEGGIVIETVSKTKSSSSSSSSSSNSSDDESRVVEKKVVVLESAPVEPVPAIESLPEEISPIVEPVKPVDSLLDEVSQVFDEIKNEEKKDLVVEETPAVVEEQEQTVDVCETAVNDDCVTTSLVVESVLEENKVENVQSLVENVSSESKDNVSSSTPPIDVNGAARANEIETIEHSDRQAPTASTTVAVQHTTSWKSCCGIFELFSGSGR